MASAMTDNKMVETESKINFQGSNDSTNNATASSSTNSTSSALTSNNSGALPVAILIDELRNNDMQIRLNSFRKLDVIARALGPVRTRDELIPYLNEFIDDEDDILLALAEELGKLIDLVGGPNYAHVLLGPLETLSGVEESVVRDKVVDSITKITNRLSPESIVKYVFPMIKRLAGGDWFTSRISAAGLFAVTYPKLDSTLKKALRQNFINLCVDETPMVRRAACAQFGKLVAVMEYEAVKSELFPSFLKLAKDDQDSVRLLTVEAAVAVTQSFKSSNNVGQLLPVIQALCSDKSWRVRYMVADKFCQLCEAVGESETKSDENLVDGFVRLLQDSEAEVRTAAAHKVGEVAKIMGPDLTLRKLLAPVRSLVKDTSQYARAALAQEIMGLATVLKKREVFDHLLPLFLVLLKDTHPDVRLNFISKLDSVNQVIGVDLLSQPLLPAICELAMDKKWRIRLAIIEQIPMLARQLGHEAFDAKLSELCMNWLGDQVYSIRAAATTNLTKLADVFGVPWAKVNIIPKVLALGSHKTYLYRMTCLFAINDMAKTVGTEVTTEVLLPVIIKLATDPVANVRFNVAKTMSLILDFLTPDAIKIYVLPCLQKLMQDPDGDVKHFASLTLEKIMNKNPTTSTPTPTTAPTPAPQN